MSRPLNTALDHLANLIIGTFFRFDAWCAGRKCEHQQAGAA